MSLDSYLDPSVQKGLEVLGVSIVAGISLNYEHIKRAVNKWRENHRQPDENERIFLNGSEQNLQNIMLLGVLKSSLSYESPEQTKINNLAFSAYNRVKDGFKTLERFQSSWRLSTSPLAKSVVRESEAAYRKYF